MVKRRAVLAGLAVLGIGGCGSVAVATIVPGKPMVAPSRVRPQLAMIRTTSGSRSATEALILVTLGSNRDTVLASASENRAAPLPRPEWSPDGRRIAFARFTSGILHGPHAYPYRRTDVFVIAADGSGLQQITHTGDAVQPVWSPDGREIVFARDHLYLTSKTVGLTGSLWSIHPDGSSLRELTATVEGQDDLPGSFSPNGRMLAFTRSRPSPPTGLDRGGEVSVELLNLIDGTTTQLAARSQDPAFSPDGKWIALSSTRDHNGTIQTGSDSEAIAGELYLVDLSGRRWRRLTHTRDINEGTPSFSPDGKRIAYVRTDAIQTRLIVDSYHDTIFQINVDGTCPTPVRDDRTAADNRHYRGARWRPGRSRPGAGLFLHC